MPTGLDLSQITVSEYIRVKSAVYLNDPSSAPCSSLSPCGVDTGFGFSWRCGGTRFGTSGNFLQASPPVTGRESR